MDHKSALDLMLSNACPCSNEDSEGYQTFAIELHCARFLIEAKCVSKPPMDTEGDFHYEIRSCVKE